MSKSLLGFYLQRVAAGDQAFMDKLIPQLAERLLYVPIQQEANSGSSVKINVLRIKEAHRSLVPVFTTERLLKSWCQAKGYESEAVSLLGADLASSLKGDMWLWVNPGTETPVELQPFMVEKVSKAVAEAAVDEPELPDEPLPQGGSFSAQAVFASGDPASPPSDDAPPKKRNFLSFLKFK
ncbi:MAG: SseB family protein [Oligoflexia bacterium]|nr:SseB family protein [Oligoflexia bacterium]